MKQEKWSQLLNLHNKNVSEEPHKVEPYLQRGHFYLRHNEIELAIVDYSLAIALNPSRFESYNSRALAYFKKKFFQQAIYDFNSALKINPYFPEVYVYRGVAYAQNKDYVQAIHDYNKSIALWSNTVYPENLQRWQAYHGRAMAQFHLDNYKECLLDILRAMTLVPQQRKIHASIAQLYTDLPQNLCFACLGDKIDQSSLKRLQSLHKQFSAARGKRKEIFQELLVLYFQTGQPTLTASLRNYQRRYFKG